VIVAEPARLLSRHYRLNDGVVSIELRFDDHAGDAGFVLDGRRYRAEAERPRESLGRTLLRALGGRQLFRLVEEGGVIGHAQGGGLRANFRVWTGDGTSYELREEGKTVRVMRDGAVLGHVGRRAGLSRGLWAELPASVPAPIRVFIVWLLLRKWETVHRGSA
jgi:hypothetical protein